MKGYATKYCSNVWVSLLIYVISSGSVFSQWQFSNYKVGDVANLKYREFGLGEWNSYQDDAYFLRAIDTVNNYMYLVFSGKKDCHEDFCNRKISIHTIKNNYMVSRFDTIWKSIDIPKFHSVFGKYVVAFEIDNPWLMEDELATMEVPEEKWRGLQFIIDQDRIIPLESLSRTSLRRVRHEVLMRKGHKHHASEITEYFLHRHKRRRVDSNAIHHDFTEAELYFLKALTDLIYVEG